MPPDQVSEKEKEDYRGNLIAETPTENHREPLSLLDQFSNRNNTTINRSHYEVLGSQFEINLHTHCKFLNVLKLKISLLCLNSFIFSQFRPTTRRDSGCTDRPTYTFA